MAAVISSTAFYEIGDILVKVSVCLISKSESYNPEEILVVNFEFLSFFFSFAFILAALIPFLSFNDCRRTSEFLLVYFSCVKINQTIAVPS